jgi:quercetin dioxygenase-like cupin family protein
MRRTVSVLAMIVTCLLRPASGQPQALVDSNGQHPRIKLSQVVSGHLTELNGKYQLRVTEVTYDPGGYIGPHHHVGPGIRCVTSGELTYVVLEKPTIYRAGECFYESGDVTHTARNDTKERVVLLNFEILPASLSTGSAIPVPTTNER